MQQEVDHLLNPVKALCKQPYVRNLVEQSKGPQDLKRSKWQERMFTEAKSLIKSAGSMIPELAELGRQVCRSKDTPFAQERFLISLFLQAAVQAQIHLQKMAVILALPGSCVAAA